MQRKQVAGYTIDSEHSMDLDDGFNIYKSGENFVLEVSVSDVASVINSESKLFQDALFRVESQYMQKRTIPMLPAQLSEDKLSLLEHKITPSITFKFLLSDDCRIKNLDIFESEFFSKRRLSYSEFDRIINQKEDDPDYQICILASQFAQHLLQKRRLDGALAIYDIKKLVYTNEEGQLQHLTKQRANIGNIVIQEFMILTNRAVAELMAQNDFPFLYRNHTVRNNAPDRNEILSQYNMALLDMSLMPQLNSRSILWFNKACVERQLKGHFGLNVNAYTQITSPIRRFADLINQQQLKCYLKSQESIFSDSLLDEMSSYINVTIEGRKAKKAEFLKLQAQRDANQLITKNDWQKLAKLDSKRFRQVLKAFCHSGEFPDGLSEAIVQRLNLNSMEALHIYTLLFNNKSYKPEMQKIIEILMEHVLKTQGLAKQILTIATQKGKEIKEINEECIEKEGYFLSRIVGDIDGNFYSVKSYVPGPNKKEAIQNASNEFLIQYLKNELIDEALTEIPAKVMISTAGAELFQKPENFVGRLNEIHQTRKEWSLPEYSFTQEGSLHNPEFNCVCTFKHRQEVFKSVGVSTDKKTAKNLAAGNMLELISVKLTKGGNTGQVRPIQINLTKTLDFTGLLLDMCVQNKWKQPEISFEKIDKMYTMLLNLEFNSRNYQFSGQATTKRDARKAASFECLKFLKEELSLCNSKKKGNDAMV